MLSQRRRKNRPKEYESVVDITAPYKPKFGIIKKARKRFITDTKKIEKVFVFTPFIPIDRQRQL